MRFEDAFQIIEQKRGWIISEAQRQALQVFFENNSHDLSLLTVEECNAVAPKGCSHFLRTVRQWVMERGIIGFKTNAFVKVSEAEALQFCFAEDVQLQSAIARELPGRATSMQTLNALQLLCRIIKNFEGLMRMTRNLYQKMKSMKELRRGVEIVRQAFLLHGGCPDVVNKSPMTSVTLSEIPDLHAWPTRLGVWFEKHVPQYEDRLHLLEFLTKIDEYTHLRFPHRSRTSSRKALLDCACVLFRMVNSLRGNQSFKDVLSFDLDTESIVNLSARVLVE